MPAIPVFISNLDTVKAQLRLSAVDTGDAAAVLDTAMAEVRVGLFDELGSSLVATIQGLATGTPSITDDQLKRLRAEGIEHLWIRMILMRRMPVLFMEGSGVGRHAWNEEGITRQASAGDLRRELRELDRQVRQGLAALKSEDTGDISAFVPVPDETPQRPGDSINPAVTGAWL